MDRKMKKCRYTRRTQFKSYECITGDCVTSYKDCPNNEFWKCSTPSIPFYCPNGDCVHNDYDCVRPCGTWNQKYRYFYRCSSFECARNEHSCPQCPLISPHKCPDGSCKERAAFCDCRGYRCADYQCLQKTWARCDGIRDCGDGSDELACNSTVQSSTSPFIVMTLLTTGVCIVLFLCFCLCVCCAYRKRRNGAILRRQEPSRQPFVTGTNPAVAPPGGHLGNEYNLPYQAQYSESSGLPGPPGLPGPIYDPGHGNYPNYPTDYPLLDPGPVRPSAPPPSYNDAMAGQHIRQ